MTNLDALIEQLSSDSLPVRPARPFVRVLGEWILVSGLYVSLLFAVAVSGRNDMPIRIHDIYFIIEAVLLIAIIVSCSYAAYCSSFPDFKQRRWAMYVPLVPTALFFLLIMYLVTDPVTPVPRAPAPDEPGWNCLACITLLSAIPAIWMVRSLRKHASIRTAYTGAMAMLTATTTGCFFLRFIEDSDDMLHLLAWHYLPLAGFAFLGIFIGRKFCRW